MHTAIQLRQAVHTMWQRVNNWQTFHTYSLSPDVQNMLLTVSRV
ncbi:MAG: hypothetical protein ACOYNW_12210 [Undibacterium curvum]|jgi:hypothetical protein